MGGETESELICNDKFVVDSKIKDIIDDLSLNIIDLESYDIRRLSTEQLKQVFIRLPDKTLIWLHKLRYVKSNYGLNAEQLEVIERAQHLLKSVDLFSDDSPVLPKRNTNDELIDLQARINATFKSSDAYQIFFTLALEESLAETLSSKVLPNYDDGKIPCNCSPSSNQCFAMRCRLGQCKTRSSGCGLFWAYSCLGTCSNRGTK